MDERSNCFLESRVRERKICTTWRTVLLSNLLGGSIGGLMGNIRHHNPQDPAIYAEEEDTGYPEPWHKGRFPEELEQVSLLQP
jgi:hypothetical protein